MAHVLTFLLVRFAVIAVVVAVVGLSLFAVAVRLKRRGKWAETRSRIAPALSRAAEGYARRAERGGQSSWKASLARGAAERFTDRDGS